jgi:hypothetical protein
LPLPNDTEETHHIIELLAKILSRLEAIDNKLEQVGAAARLLNP